MCNRFFTLCNRDSVFHLQAIGLCINGANDFLGHRTILSYAGKLFAGSLFFALCFDEFFIRSANNASEFFITLGCDEFVKSWPGSETLDITCLLSPQTNNCFSIQNSPLFFRKFYIKSIFSNQFYKTGIELRNQKK